MPDPIRLRGVPLDPRQIPFAAPMGMPSRKLSILDKLAQRLFPSLEGLSPEDAQGVGRQGLIQLGANLLQAGGARPDQPGTLANIGAAISGVDLQGLTKSALTLREARQQRESQSAMQRLAQKYQPQANETAEQRFERLTNYAAELAQIPGSGDVLGPLSNVLSQIRPQQARARTVTRAAMVDPNTGLLTMSPNGVPALVTLDANTGEQIGRASGRTAPEISPYQREQLDLAERTRALAERKEQYGNAEQNKNADFGVRILEGHATMSMLERDNPGIGQSVDAKLTPVFTAMKVPGVGRAAAVAALRAAIASMSPDEQTYYNAMSDVINARLRKVTGATINPDELETERVPLVPLAGEDESQVSKKQARRLQAARLYIRGAGPAFDPSLLSPEALELYQPKPKVPQPPAPAGSGWRSLRPRE